MTKIELFEEMLKHRQLEKLHSDLAKRTKYIGNGYLSDYYANEATYHARERIRIKTVLEGSLKQPLARRRG